MIGSRSIFNIIIIITVEAFIKKKTLRIRKSSGQRKFLKIPEKSVFAIFSCFSTNKMLLNNLNTEATHFFHSSCTQFVHITFRDIKILINLKIFILRNIFHVLSMIPKKMIIFLENSKNDSKEYNVGEYVARTIILVIFHWCLSLCMWILLRTHYMMGAQ